MIDLKHPCSRSLGLAALLAAAAGICPAQTTYPGTLEQFKAETIRRTGIAQYPMTGYTVEDVRGALENLKAKTDDGWAGAFMPVGDRYLAKAKQEESSNKAAAMNDYAIAYRYYVLARWPTPISPLKKQAYRKSLDTFFAWDKLTDLPTQIIRTTFEGKEVVGLLRMPKSNSPAPLLVQLGGLDGYKENGGMEGSLRYARMGVAVLSLDSPGTSQAVKVSAQAWQSIVKIMDQVTTRPDIDKNRVVLHGGSWGSYWSDLIAHAAPERFKGAVVHGAPVDHSFAASHIEEVVKAGEYFFDWIPALMDAYDGVTTLDQLKAKFPELSLKKLGYLDKPTPPMLVLNGAKDSLFPIDDLFLLLNSGTAKDAWVNPKGIHMGREAGVWENARIADEVVTPWVLRHLGMPPLPAAQPVSARK